MSAPSTIDLQVPFDPTAYTSITGAQFKQLVAGTYPNTDKGLVIVTTDVGTSPEVPDAITETKWKKYVWVRQSSASVGLYVWNDNAATDATFLKWQSITISGIGVNAIQTYMINDVAVTSDKILSLDASKLTGSIPGGVATNLLSTTTSFFGGDIVSGSLYNTLTIAPGAINNSKLANDSVTGVKILDNTIQPAKLVGNVSGYIMKAAPGGSGGVWSEANALVQASIASVALPSNNNKYLAIKSDGTAYELVAMSVVKRQSNLYSTIASTTTTLAITGTAPTTGNMDLMTTLGTAGVIAFTTLKAGTTVDVEITIPVSASGSDPYAVFVLFSGSTPVACVTQVVDPSSARNTIIKYSYASTGAGATTNFSLYWARSNSTNLRTLYTNSVNNVATGCAAFLASSVTFTEHF